MNQLKKLLFVSIILMGSATFSSDYIIYSVMHDLPMGDGKETKKNYYLNLGEKQGVKDGTLVNVYRTIIQNDPYESKRRYNYSIKVGQLKIIHSDSDASIATGEMLANAKDTPLFEIPNFMVGDQVKVHVD